MFSIYKRELHSYFFTPLGYVFMTAFLVISGVVFSYTTMMSAIAGNDANVGLYFTILIFTFSLLLPVLTMRSFADDRRMKTEQLLMTAPVSLPGMVCAKFLAAYTVFAGTFAVSWLDFIVLYLYKDQSKVITEQNTAELIGYCVAVLLLGGAFIAIGIFISSLTEHQMTAAVATIGVLIFCLSCNLLNEYIAFYPLRYLCNWISVYSRFTNFTYGMFDFNAVIYYVSIMVVFLFLTVRVYEKRRWD